MRRSAVLGAIITLLWAAAATAGPPPCHGADTRPSRAEPGVLALATTCLINRERARHGRPALEIDRYLRRAALGHARTIADSGSFSHVAPDGSTATARARSAGYPLGASWAIAENIGFATGYYATPRQMVRSWMASPGHRHNILGSSWVDIAVGAVARAPGTGQPGATYVVMFGRSRG